MYYFFGGGKILWKSRGCCGQGFCFYIHITISFYLFYLKGLLWHFIRGVIVNYIDIINRKIKNVDEKIAGCIEDYKNVGNLNHTANGILQYLRTLVEHVAARIYADDYPEKNVSIGDRSTISGFTKHLKDKNEYRFLSELHESLQKTVSHYVPEGDGAERLMLMYLPRLQQLKVFVKARFGLDLLENIDDYPIEPEEDLTDYYRNIYKAIYKMNPFDAVRFSKDRYYVIKRKVIKVDNRIIFELTLSYAQDSISRYDRFIAYALEDIPENNSIHADFGEATVTLNSMEVTVKGIVDWNVSIRPCEFRRLLKIANEDKKVYSRDKFYTSLMKYITQTGQNLLDIITGDNYEKIMKELGLDTISPIKNSFDTYRKIILNNWPGVNVASYLLTYPRNTVLKDQYSYFANSKLSGLKLDNGVIPFEEHPFSTNLLGHKIPTYRVKSCLQCREDDIDFICATVEDAATNNNAIYTEVESNNIEYYKLLAEQFNNSLYESTRQQARRVEFYNSYMYSKKYYEGTRRVIELLQKFTEAGLPGYETSMAAWVSGRKYIDDENKKSILKKLFSNSKVGIIYGAAGTGKTQIIEYVTDYFKSRKILLLAQTNPAKNNLVRRVSSYTSCMTVYEYVHKGGVIPKYDLIIIDECSTVCNEDIIKVLENSSNELLLLVGDIYQIESIEFGNWFNFSRFFLPQNAVNELTVPHRAKGNIELIEAWNAVRSFDEYMFEKLQNKEFIHPIDETVYRAEAEDEIILCLGYNGVYGINNINRFLQQRNPAEAVAWGEWIYKVGDKILFNESKRFGTVLYNNLKGVITAIKKFDDSIRFTIEIEKELSADDVRFTDIELLQPMSEGKSLIVFSVKEYVENDEDDEDDGESIVPFQVAYAVSIHKAQGLEYDSVKVIITDDIDERITHNIFYTAITRSKSKLKIYMSGKSQAKLAERFKKDNSYYKQAHIFAGHSGFKMKNVL